MHPCNAALPKTILRVAHADMQQRGHAWIPSMRICTLDLYWCGSTKTKKRCELQVHSTVIHTLSSHDHDRHIIEQGKGLSLIKS